MKKIQAWIERSLVPVINKITQMYWFSIVSDAILFIVPFSMVSSIPSLWRILRNFLPMLPDISPLSDYSFGLVGLLMVFIIPYNAMVRENKKDKSVIAGFTAIGTYMMCMNPEAVETGRIFVFEKFGAGGMFTAIVIGLIVGMIYKKLVNFSFFSEDSMIPDFIKNWFDNIIAILLCLILGYLFTFVIKIDVFTFISVILSPVTGIAQTLPGIIMIVLVMDVFYFFGVSGWVFVPVVGSITRAALADNAAAVAQGLTPTKINAFGFSKYYQLGGQCATLPLAIMMLFAKSKRYKMLGRATIVPSLFNINEPLVFSCIVNNPFMIIPIMVNAIVLPTVSFLWITAGMGVANYMNFDMQFLPNFVQIFFFTGGNWGNVILVLVDIAIASLVWFPFFMAADRYEMKKEQAIVNA